MHGPQVGVCRVCGELTSVTSNATCLQCGSAFHLALRQDVPDKDCGQVWINEETQTLEFACYICLGRADPAAPASAPARRRYARSTATRAADLLREKRRRRRET
jgi:hypothetical protein